MGLHAYSDLDELLKAAQLDGKSVYVIPNGFHPIPQRKGQTNEMKTDIAKRFEHCPPDEALIPGTGPLMTSLT